MKNCFVLFLCFMILFSNLLNATNIKDVDNSKYTKELMTDTLHTFQEVSDIYDDFSEKNFSEIVWKRHGLLVTNESALKNKYDTKNPIKKGQRKEVYTRYNNNSYSFLGLTPEDYLVENPDYPADTVKIEPFSTFKWSINKNTDTSLLYKLSLLKIDRQNELNDFYWNLIDSSFSREYSKYYFSDQVSEKMKQDILNAAILVYPIAEVPRHMVSFRHSGERYEVTAFTERGFQLPPPEVTTTEESIPSLPIATQSKGNTLLIGSNQPGVEIFSNAYVYAVKREEVQSKKLDKGKVTLEPKQGYGVAAYPNQTN